MRNIILIGAFVGVSASVPILLQASPEGFHAVLRPAQETPPAASATPASKLRVASPGQRKISIPADGSGHFRTELRVNGRRIDGLIDTGATYLAINETTARRIGVPVARSDFKHDVSTANGRTKAAVVRIDSVEIGRIRVANVNAVVLEDQALHSTLVGMNVLKQLARFEVKDDVLHMEH